MNAASAIDYESIFLHAPVGMCMSENRIMRSCNEALASMFGYARAQLDDQSFEVLYPTHDEFLRTGDRIIPIMNTKGRYSDERIMRRSNGELFWCHVTGHAMLPGQPLGAGIWTFDGPRHAAGPATGSGHLDVRGCQRETPRDGPVDPARA